MKLTYITNARLPTEKANGIQIMQMCEAFSSQGLEVELVVPRRVNHIKDDPFEFYDVEKNFSITRLPTIDFMPIAGPFKWLAYWINYLIFSEIAFWCCLFNDSDVYYGRHELPLLYLSLWKDNVYWEAHQPRDSFITKLLLRAADGVVAISSGLKDFFVSGGYSEEKILVAHDAVDIDQFDINLSKQEAREQVGLPQDKKIVMYTGHLYEEKGVNTLAKAAKQLPESHLVVFVGGTDKDIQSFRNQYEKTDTIHIAGRVQHKEIPVWLKAADVLVIPNSGEDETSAKYTSPMKLFEYMASGRPIIASDVSSLRDVLSDMEAQFFSPDDPDMLASSIQNLDNERAQEMSQKTKEKVQDFSWEKRAQNIISFIKS